MIGEKIMLILKKLISDNYDLEVNEIKLIEGQFCEIYAVTTNKGKYAVKTLQLDYNYNLEDEGYITEYMHNHGIKVARLLKTNNNMYHVKADDFQFHIQEFIEGEVLKVNTAPEWYMEKSAYILGKIHSILKDYKELNTQFGEDFFSQSTVNGVKSYYQGELSKALEQKPKDDKFILDLEERVKNLERISGFIINANKLTYTNSHGDFYTSQTITNNKNITVIDWTSACRLPACLEIIKSYIFASPECKNGKIDSGGLKRYIDYYLKYSSLNDYDIQIMPYLYYYQQLICNYHPSEYDNLPYMYTPICKLIINVTNWLYENVDILADEMRTI